MRAYGSEANWDEASLHAWKNMPVDFFGENSAIEQELPTPDTDQAFYESEDPMSQRPEPTPCSVTLAEIIDFAPIRKALTHQDSDDTYESLPIQAYEQQIVEAVADNPFTFVKAPTAGGKTTQVGKMLHRVGWEKICHTHPRKPAARNAFYRQLYEMGIEFGEDYAKQALGYRMRGEAEGPADAAIMHVTDGLELAIQLATHNRGEKAVVIVDEVHESSTNMELLAGLCKAEVRKNPNLRFVFMSADIDIEHFSDFVADVVSTPPPVIVVEGRRFSVDRQVRPEIAAIDMVLQQADQILTRKKTDPTTQNGILVFLPGVKEIKDLTSELERRLPAEIAKESRVLPLYSRLSPAAQQQALQTYEGGVTIIAATNIAETSLTIPGVGVVIDAGGVKRHVELDKEGGQGLVLTDISLAEINQRAGRAGRVAPGAYYLTKLNSQTPLTPLQDRLAHQIPEILRTDMTSTVLKFAAAGYNLLDFETPTKINPDSIILGQRNLRVLGALDDQGVITARGLKMNSFSVQAPSARALVEVQVFNSRTQACMAAIVAAQEAGYLQDFTPGTGKAWEVVVSDTSSDMFQQLELFLAVRDKDTRELHELNIDVLAVERANETFQLLCRRLGVRPQRLAAPNDDEKDNLRHCILSGDVNNIYRHIGNGVFRHVGDSEFTREKSDRSGATDQSEYIVGRRYRVVRSGKEKHILEGVTTATAAQIGRAAVEQTVWKSQDFIKKDGLYYEVERAYINEQDFRFTRERRAEASPRFRQQLVQDALHSPSTNQLRLRALKKELEELSHLTEQYVRPFTQDMLEDIIRRATSDDTTATWTIDNNIGQIILEAGIRRDQFVSDAQYDHIIANAPSYITTARRPLKLTYKSGTPMVSQRHYSRADIVSMHEAPCLEDGRPVVFIHEGKPRTLYQLQTLLLGAGV